MRALIVITSALVIAACGKKGPTAEKVSSPPPEPDATEAAAEEVAEPAAEEVAAEPQILPPSEKEKTETWAIFIKEGRKFARGMSAERMEIIGQLQGIKLEEETAELKPEVDAMVTKLSEFELGDKDEVLETAATRMCTLITEAKALSEKLLAYKQDELVKVTAELKHIDEVLADPNTKEKITQKTIDKAEALQKRLSGPALIGRYMQLTIKSILDEGLVLVDYGANRGRRALYECLTKIQEKPFEFELTQKNIEHVTARAKKLLSVPY